MAIKKICLGMLAMVLVFGMMVVGCDNSSTDNNGGNNNGGYGSVRVVNSTSKSMAAELLRMSDSAIIGQNYGGSITWTNVPSGIQLRVRVNSILSSTFTLTSGQMKTLTYNGSSVQ